MNVAPVVCKTVSTANPVTSTLLPFDLLSVNVWLASLYVPPVTLISVSVELMSTLNVSPPLFLVKVTIPVLPSKVAPVTNSLVSVNELIYPASE